MGTGAEIDREVLRHKYREERDKRLRPDVHPLDLPQSEIFRWCCAERNTDAPFRRIAEVDAGRADGSRPPGLAA